MLPARSGSTLSARKRIKLCVPEPPPAQAPGRRSFRRRAFGKSIGQWNFIAGTARRGVNRNLTTLQTKVLADCFDSAVTGDLVTDVAPLYVLREMSPAPQPERQEVAQQHQRNRHRGL